MLTCFRIVLALFFPFVPPGSRGAVLLGALATEYLDGFTARRFGWESELGRLLDPIADKLFFALAAATFLLERRISWAELVAVGIRDIIVAAGTLGLILRGEWSAFRRMKPLILGKTTTALQYAVLFLLAFGHRIPPLLAGGVFLVGAAAAIQYLAAFLRSG